MWKNTSLLLVFVFGSKIFKLKDFLNRTGKVGSAGKDVIESADLSVTPGIHSPGGKNWLP